LLHQRQTDPVIGAAVSARVAALLQRGSAPGRSAVRRTPLLARFRAAQGA